MLYGCIADRVRRSQTMRSRACCDMSRHRTPGRFCSCKAANGSEADAGLAPMPHAGTGAPRAVSPWSPGARDTSFEGRKNGRGASVSARGVEDDVWADEDAPRNETAADENSSSNQIAMRSRVMIGERELPPPSPPRQAVRPPQAPRLPIPARESPEGPSASLSRNSAAREPCPTATAVEKPTSSRTGTPGLPRTLPAMRG
ncbi:hypothetical protein PsYK624_005890 [Phanerochaete sordida]|uniref:Uncharacterized protein n=1 Tax=Phanerochaete sordida TaxID=48140 RepID=A0A9P3FWR6_9APHY|nr:hypothetical protein PsYK624_005890 [Phanerochaete sordida]